VDKLADYVRVAAEEGFLLAGEVHLIDLASHRAIVEQMHERMLGRFRLLHRET
jgi:hypothetical protein